MAGFEFRVLKRAGLARLGYLRTPHGGFHTPVFMPVGTNAGVRLLRPSDLERIGVEVILSNAFHLHLRPGMDVIKKHRGLHNFMSWKKTVLTDSGGFQVFSLEILGISDSGVYVRSPIDGSGIFVSPEISMEVQKVLGSDIVMMFDQCVHPEASRVEVEESVRRTTLWAERSKRYMEDSNQILFGIVQGGVFEDLRRRSASEIASIGFDGYAVGGLSVGEPREITLRMTEVSLEYLPEERPRYFMGAGSPELIIELVSMGIDMFDSVFPTRLARHGTALTWKGRLNLRSARYRYDTRPIDEECACETCTNFSRSYVHHLLSRKEVLGQILLTVHNVSFMVDFMRRIRERIEDGSFEDFKDEFLVKYPGVVR